MKTRQSDGTVSGPRVPKVMPIERWLAKRLLRSLNCPQLSLEFWSGEKVSTCESDLGRVAVRDRQTFWRLITNPLVAFGDAYTDGRIEIQRDLLKVLCEINRAMAAHLSRRNLWRHFRWHRRPHRRTAQAAVQNIHHHYDIGDAFYELWLDQQLLYTCAYFEHPNLTLEAAQIAKMDHVCRKLWLQPGETVIEAGCGWGALALHMAREYGVRVRAYNISTKQIDYARRRARAEGLDEQVEFVQEDWRRIDGRCDAFVSIGMLEHVGPENYCELGRIIHNCLGEQGRGLIHTIGVNQPRPLDPWTERRIFPGAQPPSLREITQVFEPFQYSVLDVENLRLHYAETLQHWLKRFEAASEKIAKLYDERFVRMWRLYLTASVAAFETGWLQLFQVVFAGGTNNHIPWTRRHLYATEAAWTRDSARN